MTLAQEATGCLITRSRATGGNARVGVRKRAPALASLGWALVQGHCGQWSPRWIRQVQTDHAQLWLRPRVTEGKEGEEKTPIRHREEDARHRRQHRARRATEDAEDGHRRQRPPGRARHPRAACTRVRLYAHTVAPATDEHCQSTLFWLTQVRCDALLASPCPARVARGFFNAASREHHQGHVPPDIHGQIDNAGRW